MLTHGDRELTQKFDTNLASMVVWSGEPMNLGEMCNLTSILKRPGHFFQEVVPRLDSFADVPIRKEYVNTDMCIYIYTRNMDFYAVFQKNQSFDVYQIFKLQDHENRTQHAK